MTVSVGIVRPGMGSTSPRRQSRSTPPGWAVSAGVSWPSAVATRSRRTPRCPVASWLNAAAMPWNASKSVRHCQGGATAALNECTKGCMSVLDRSCFSYQVAAGSTMSENRVVLVIRKSSDSSRSSLPSAACSVRRTSAGGRSGSVERGEASVPSRCLRKNSLPLADEPSKLERHTVSTRGQLAGASGSSPAKPSRPACNSRTTCSPGSSPAASASSARSSGLRSKVG